MQHMTQIFLMFKKNHWTHENHLWEFQNSRKKGNPHFVIWNWKSVITLSWNFWTTLNTRHDFKKNLISLPHTLQKKIDQWLKKKIAHEVHVTAKPCDLWRMFEIGLSQENIAFPVNLATTHLVLHIFLTQAFWHTYYMFKRALGYILQLVSTFFLFTCCDLAGERVGQYNISSS